MRLKDFEKFCETVKYFSIAYKFLIRLDVRFPFIENFRAGLDYGCLRNLWLREKETGTELVFLKAERGLK